MSVERPNAADQSAHALHRRHHPRRRHHYRHVLTKAHGGQVPLPPRRPNDLTGTPYINPTAAAQAHAAEQQRAIGLLNGNVAVSPYVDVHSLYTPAAQGASAGHGFGWRAGVEVPLTEKFAVLGEVGQSNIGDIKNTTNRTTTVVTQVPVGYGRYMPATTTALTTTPSVTNFNYKVAMAGVSADLGKITGWEPLKAFKMDLLGGVAMAHSQTDYVATTQATTVMGGKTVDGRTIVTPGKRGYNSVGPVGEARLRANLNTLLEQAGGPKVTGVQAEVYADGMAAKIKSPDGKTRITGGYGGGFKVSVPF